MSKQSPRQRPAPGLRKKQVAGPPVDRLKSLLQSQARETLPYRVLSFYRTQLQRETT